jgi:hypothetical protein
VEAGDRTVAQATTDFEDWYSGVVATARAITPFMRDQMAQEFKRPIELAGLKARLQRARDMEQNIGEIGRQYDAILTAVEEKVAQAQAHLGQLKQYDAELSEMVRQMIGESNNPPYGRRRARRNCARACGHAAHARSGKSKLRKPASRRNARQAAGEGMDRAMTG